MQSTSHANADAGINTQAGSSAIDRGNGGGWRDRKRHAEFVSRRDDLSSEGNVSRRCANADAETHVLHMSLQESETAAAAVASKWVSHLEGKARREFVRSQRERQTRQRERGVCGYDGGRVCVRSDYYSSRPRSPRRSQPKCLTRLNRVRLQTCLRDRRARLVLHVGSSRWWLVPGPARAAAARQHENRQLARPPEHFCQRLRRRGGAELSGRGTEGVTEKGCVVGERAREAEVWLRRRSKHSLTYARAESTVWLSGCPAAQARSSETLLRHALHLHLLSARAERLQARVSNSKAWYSRPPGRNERLQREAANTSRRLLALLTSKQHSPVVTLIYDRAEAKRHVPCSRLEERDPRTS